MINNTEEEIVCDNFGNKYTYKNNKCIKINDRKISSKDKELHIKTSINNDKSNKNNITVYAIKAREGLTINIANGIYTFEGNKGYEDKEYIYVIADEDKKNKRLHGVRIKPNIKAYDDSSQIPPFLTMEHSKKNTAYIVCCYKPTKKYSKTKSDKVIGIMYKNFKPKLVEQKIDNGVFYYIEYIPMKKKDGKFIQENQAYSLKYCKYKINNNTVRFCHLEKFLKKDKTEEYVPVWKKDCNYNNFCCFNKENNELYMLSPSSKIYVLDVDVLDKGDEIKKSVKTILNIGVDTNNHLASTIMDEMFSIKTFDFSTTTEETIIRKNAKKNIENIELNERKNKSIEANKRKIFNNEPDVKKRSNSYDRSVK